uniref:Uncharacterized protein n=1 Tax=Anguilla anguilla TaxID=7936 RepID=A0A0E9UZC5_ANGAN
MLELAGAFIVYDLHYVSPVMEYLMQYATNGC